MLDVVAAKHQTAIRELGAAQQRYDEEVARMKGEPAKHIEIEKLHDLARQLEAERERVKKEQGRAIGARLLRVTRKAKRAPSGLSGVLQEPFKINASFHLVRDKQDRKVELGSGAYGKVCYL